MLTVRLLLCRLKKNQSYILRRKVMTVHFHVPISYSANLLRPTEQSNTNANESGVWSTHRFQEKLTNLKITSSTCGRW